MIVAIHMYSLNDLLMDCIKRTKFINRPLFFATTQASTNGGFIYVLNERERFRTGLI